MRELWSDFEVVNYKQRLDLCSKNSGNGRVKDARFCSNGRRYRPSTCLLENVVLILQTEFTNSTALSRKATTSWAKMESHPDEEPFIPQIFGGDVNDMVTAAILLSESADIIDLNFGCPAPKVTKICAGAALMGEPDNLVNMVKEIIENVDIPVTAKMRLGTGSGENNVLQISKELESIGVSRICIHGRTLKQRYMGEADWSQIAEVVANVPVVANGDVVDAKSAAACLKHTAASGLMIGRGAIGRPNIFAEIKMELGWMTRKVPWIDERWHKLDELQQQLQLVHGAGIAM